MNETSTLAGFLSGLTYDDLPAQVIETAKLCILDTVGVALAARSLPWASFVCDQARENGGVGDATLWGSAGQVPAQQAALANGTAAHGIEMDDRIPSGQMHPGAMAVPAALALGEKIAADGRRLITAVVAGYELGVRVAMTIRFREPGLHWAGHKGVWPAVGAAAKILDLDHQQTSDAYGLAGSMAGGLGEFSRDPRGTMVKRLHAGLAASHGVLAAQLAQRGMTGPSTVLEGLYGYCRVFASGGEPNFAELDQELGAEFRILRRELKAYASWGGGQNAIDAVAEILSGRDVDVDHIANVHVAGSKLLTETHSHREPESVMSAQYSLPFLTALALRHGPAALMNPSVWTDDVLTDPGVTELVARIAISVDPELNAAAVQTKDIGGVRLTVVMDDGARYDATVHHWRGTRQNPMTPEEIRAKFRAVTMPFLPNGRADDIVAAVDALDSETDVTRLGRLLEIRLER